MNSATLALAQSTEQNILAVVISLGMFLTVVLLIAFFVMRRIFRSDRPKSKGYYRELTAPEKWAGQELVNKMNQQNQRPH